MESFATPKNPWIQQFKEKNEKLFVQFGGQGTPYFKELLKYYGNERFEPFFDTVLSAIEEISDKTQHWVLPHGLAVADWLKNPEKAPNNAVLASTGISFGMIQVTQLAHLENLFVHGVSKKDFYSITSASSGHSQGIVPATFYALNLRGDEYYSALAVFVKFLFMMGFKAQEVYKETFPSQQEIDQSNQLGTSEVAPMVAVLGENHSTIESMVDEFNAKVDGSQKVFISLINTPTNRILSAPRSALIKFYEKNHSELKKQGFKFIYLQTSCPFHSEHLREAIEKFSPEIASLGFSFKGENLKIPVYSFSNQVEKNLQNSKNLGETLCKELMVNQLNWKNPLEPIAKDPSITQIIDFGPGKTSTRLTSELLKSLKVEKPILTLSTEKDQKKILS